MKIIYLDDEIILLNYFETIIKNIKEITSYKLFSDSDKAIEYIKYEKVDIVFLDISMPKINGIEVAKIIRKFDKIVNIVFITSFEEYAIKAFDVEAKGYILKPFDEADIRKEVNKVYKNKRMDLNERVFIKTFGRFDVFVDGLAIHFKSSKSKELLALLVDNQGGVITMEVAISILWEDRVYDESVKSLYRAVLKSLRETLKEVGILEILIEHRNKRCVDKTKFICDYYELLKNDRNMILSFKGEYMNQYNWAETTNGYICRLVEEKLLSKISLLN